MNVTKVIPISCWVGQNGQRIYDSEKVFSPNGGNQHDKTKTTPLLILQEE